MAATPFTYSAPHPETGKVSFVRLLVGDTVAATAVLSDDDINAFLSVQSNVVLAAANAADALAALYARQVTKTIGKTRIEAGKRAQEFRELADRLRTNAGSVLGGDGLGQPSAPMIVGGISRAERADLLVDHDTVRPSFRLGQDDEGVGFIDGAESRLTGE